MKASGAATAGEPGAFSGPFSRPFSGPFSGPFCKPRSRSCSLLWTLTWTESLNLRTTTRLPRTRRAGHHDPSHSRPTRAARQPTDDLTDETNNVRTLVRCEEPNPRRRHRVKNVRNRRDRNRRLPFTRRGPTSRDRAERDEQGGATRRPSQPAYGTKRANLSNGAQVRPRRPRQSGTAGSVRERRGAGVLSAHGSGPFRCPGRPGARRVANPAGIRERR